MAVDMNNLSGNDASDQETAPPKQEVLMPAAPDGGARAWFHAFLGHMLFFNTWGITNSYGVFQQYYTTHLETGPSAISWIGAVPVFLLFLLGIFSGRASDAGYFRHVFYSGVALQVLGMVAASFCTKYYQILLAQGVCVGIGNGLIFTPGLSVTSSYFKEKRSVAVGIAASGAGTGGMVYPAIVNQLINTRLGYSWTMRVLALVILITHIPAMVGYRPYLPKRSTGPLVDTAALKQKSFVFFTVGFFLHFWGLYMPFFFLGIFAREELHMSSSNNLLLVLNGVGVIGRILPNLIGQTFTGVMNITILFSLISALLLYCWAAITSVSGVYVWVVFNGIFAGGMQALFPTLATQQAPEANKVGTWTGMVLTVVSFACLTSAPIQGALIQALGGRYIGAQMFSASSIIVGGVLLVVARQSKTGGKIRIKI